MKQAKNCVQKPVMPPMKNLVVKNKQTNALSLKIILRYFQNYKLSFNMPDTIAYAMNISYKKYFSRF